jgi:hypothetical protein
VRLPAVAGRGTVEPVTCFQIPLVEFAARVRGGDGELRLTEMLASLEEDPVERLVVDELARQLVRDGSFREPVVLLPTAYGETIGDGRHRTAAHFRTGTSPVKARLGYDPSGFDDTLLRVTFELFDAPVDGMPLRSLPVGESWAVADVAAVLDPGREDPRRQVVCYSFWASGCTIEALTESARVRAASLGFSVRVLDARVDDGGDDLPASHPEARGGPPPAG